MSPTFGVDDLWVSGLEAFQRLLLRAWKTTSGFRGKGLVEGLVTFHSTRMTRTCLSGISEASVPQTHLP